MSNDQGVINSSPRPRLLVRGFEGEDDLVERLLNAAPTSKRIAHFREVRQAEWDVLVTDEPVSERVSTFGAQSVRELDHDICVVFRARSPETDPFGSDVEFRRGWSGEIEYSCDHVCIELRRCGGLQERIAILTHEHLESVLKQREAHQVFREKDFPSNIMSDQRPQPRAPRLASFIETADGKCLAGRYARSERSEAWVLPHDVPDLVAWVKAALAEWHSVAPDRFPGVPDWSHLPSWQTSAERCLQAEIENLEAARVAAMAEFDRRRNELLDDLAEARQSADGYERALLTGQDEPLRVAVMKALDELGLTVTDADAEAAPGDDLEDLRVSDPDAPGWVALVEVKGYRKGAKTEAIGQFLRFQKRYFERCGRPADSEWYVVNQFLGRDPATRQRVLQGNPGDVSAFGLGGGLIIDTTVLFRLLLDVRDARRTANDVRALLRNSRGRLELTP